MVFITRDILKKLLLMSLLMTLNTPVFAMVHESIKSLDQEVCDDDSDFDDDCNGEEKQKEIEDAPENASMCKKIMRCGRVVLIGYLALYHAHPIIQSVQSAYVHQGQKFKEWGDGPIRQNFDSLERANDVCRPPMPAKKPGCCNAGNKDTLVCCHTNIRQCFSIPLDDVQNNNMYGFDHDGEPESFNSGNYMQRGNVVLKDRQELKESDDEEEEPIEVPDELFVYTVGGGSFAEDKADLIQACKRKGLSDEMKNLLLRALRKNYGR